MDSDHVFLFALNFFWEPSLLGAAVCHLPHLLRVNGNIESTHRHVGNALFKNL